MDALVPGSDREQNGEFRLYSIVLIKILEMNSFCMYGDERTVPSALQCGSWTLIPYWKYVLECLNLLVSEIIYPITL